MTILAAAGFSIEPQGSFALLFLIILVFLPFGWTVFKESPAFEALAILQIVIVLFALVFSYRFARRRGCGKIQSALIAILVYGGSCLLTNMLGLGLFEQRWEP